MIIKNQHLLAGLVVLGVLQLWALGCLERASSGVESRLEKEITRTREDQQKATEVLARETVELKHQLNETHNLAVRTQSELQSTQDLLKQTRMELDKVKAAAGGEERKP
jgi:hypothetical protein